MTGRRRNFREQTVGSYSNQKEGGHVRIIYPTAYQDLKSCDPPVIVCASIVPHKSSFCWYIAKQNICTRRADRPAFVKSLQLTPYYSNLPYPYLTADFNFLLQGLFNDAPDWLFLDAQMIGVDNWFRYEVQVPKVRDTGNTSSKLSNSYDVVHVKGQLM